MYHSSINSFFFFFFFKLITLISIGMIGVQSSPSKWTPLLEFVKGGFGCIRPQKTGQNAIDTFFAKVCQTSLIYQHENNAVK